MCIAEEPGRFTCRYRGCEIEAAMAYSQRCKVSRRRVRVFSKVAKWLASCRGRLKVKGFTGEAGETASVTAGKKWCCSWPVAGGLPQTQS